jgi:hypothetical protein
MEQNNKKEENENINIGFSSFFEYIKLPFGPILI